MSSTIEQIARALVDSKRTVILSGAGISTESGIPDYRGTSSHFWEKYSSQDFSLSTFLKSEEGRIRCWQTSMVLYQIIRNAHPNPAHYALAELERMKLLRGIITQNVDGLHQKAGSSRKIIVELHGTVHSISCLDCGRKYDCETVYTSVSKGVTVPYCDYCQGILKPNTIFPGEPLFLNIARRALQMATSSKLFLVVGSSLEVQPASYLPIKAKEAGAKLAIINLSPTPYDNYTDYLIYGPAGQTLSEIVKQVNTLAPHVSCL